MNVHTLNFLPRILIPCCLFLFSDFAWCQPKVPSDLPDIVFIMADDMDFECVGSNWNIEYKTQKLDRLAASGIRFEHFYSPPLCTPSRVKIMTGKYNFRNYKDFGYLNPNENIFVDVLTDVGQIPIKH